MSVKRLHDKLYYRLYAHIKKWRYFTLLSLYTIFLRYILMDSYQYEMVPMACISMSMLITFPQRILWEFSFGFIRVSIFVQKIQLHFLLLFWIEYLRFLLRFVTHSTFSEQHKFMFRERLLDSYIFCVHVSNHQIVNMDSRWYHMLQMMWEPCFLAHLCTFNDLFISLWLMICQNSTHMVQVGICPPVSVTRGSSSKNISHSLTQI